MRNTGAFVVGIVLIVVGGAYLMENLGYGDITHYVWKLWPLFLIFIGLEVVLRRPWSSKGEWNEKWKNEFDTSAGKAQSPSDYYVNNTVFGDISNEITSQFFGGGTVSVVFGEIELDLRKAKLRPGSNTLKLSAVFGSIKVIVPDSMAILTQANLVGGDIMVLGQRRSGFVQAFSHSSPGYEQSDARITIIASLVFGDIKIG
jgi:lia operon protein LiaF